MTGTKRPGAAGGGRSGNGGGFKGSGFKGGGFKGGGFKGGGAKGPGFKGSGAQGSGAQGSGTQGSGTEGPGSRGPAFRGPRPEGAGFAGGGKPRRDGDGDRRPFEGRKSEGGQHGERGDRPRGPARPGFSGKPFSAGGPPRRNNRPPVQGIEPRQLAVDLVAAVQRGRLLDQELDDGRLAQRYQSLEPRDRAMTRAIVGITLRRWGQIQDALGRFIDRPLPDDAGVLKPALAVAAAQVLFMEIGDHAAVALAVDIVAGDKAGAGFKGLANAVLRRLAGDKAAILASQDPATLNTPAWMMARWTEAYGAETAAGIARAHLVEPSLDLTVKSDAEGWATRLGGIVLPNGSVRLVGHGAVEKIDGYDEGAWWVQDAAATFPVTLLGDVDGLKVLDLCAAPGGKTAALAFRGGKVTAVDLAGRRLGRLQRNLTRLGLKADTIVADATEWFGGSFDRILLDAPCSATGTLRRHPDGMVSKSPGDIATLAALQRRLLDQAIRMLRPGGVLVYSTCSLEPEEGPDQIRRLLQIGAPVERRPVTADEVAGHSELITADGDLRTLPIHYPHPDPRLSGLDGFFAARLVRTY